MPCSFPGMVKSSVFDRLVATSLSTDSRLVTNNSLSGTRKFITSGSNPFIGWYELKEVGYVEYLLIFIDWKIFCLCSKVVFHVNSCMDLSQMSTMNDEFHKIVLSDEIMSIKTLLYVLIALI